MFKPCILVPTYNNPQTVRDVVERARGYLTDVIVVDDGSGPEGRAACEAIGSDGLAHVHHRARNGGKGAAVKSGFSSARELGYTHALQIDADSQHDLESIPRFLEAAQDRPSSLVLGYPVYDETVPTVRRIARGITRFWVALEVGRKTIYDAMVGFRVYPLDAVDEASVRGDRMDFDIEVAVKMAWSGVDVVNLPVRVRYLQPSEGGVSHFQPLRDNLRFFGLHTRLCTQACFRWLGRLFGVIK